MCKIGGPRANLELLFENQGPRWKCLLKKRTSD
jgi:hypothetical protein